MGVPRELSSTTEHSTRPSYDGGHIERIRRRHDTTTTRRPAVESIMKLPSLFDERHFRSTTDGNILRKKFEELLNKGYPHNDLVWIYPPEPTIDYSYLAELPHMEPPRVVFVHKHSKAWVISTSVTVVLFIICCVLKLIRCYARLPEENNCSRRRPAPVVQSETPSISNTYPQQQTDNTGSPQDVTTSSLALLIDTEMSTNTDSRSDLPPSYVECATTDKEINNKSLENSSEELPPPYSSCHTTLSNTDEGSKVYTRGSVKGSQPYNDGDIRVHNVEVSRSVNPEETNGGHVGEATIDIGNIEAADHGRRPGDNARI